MSKTLDLTKELIARKSVTPEDDGCQKLVSERLSKIGFLIEDLQYGDVKIYGQQLGNQDLYLYF